MYQQKRKTMKADEGRGSYFGIRWNNEERKALEAMAKEVNLPMVFLVRKGTTDLIDRLNDGDDAAVAWVKEVRKLLGR